ncbi:MAG: DUF3990 domain-containing protein [bacterium]
MIVYHGSAQCVERPDVVHSLRPLDFGRGFYVTTVREQAERWAQRKARLQPAGIAFVNRYECGEDWGGFSVKTFSEDLLEWIDFVCHCRDGGLGYLGYDLIAGRVANDKVFRVVDFYHAGIWDRERALREIRAYERYDQIAFITQKAVDSLLRFQGSEEV